MTVTEKQVLEALRSVPEPCSVLMKEPMDICEMGLVEEVAISGSHVAISLVLTDPSCVHFLGMRRYIIDTVVMLAGVTDVAVTMSTTQLWTSDRVRRRRSAAV